MTSNSIGFYCSTYVTTRYDIVTVECIESKKSEGQTSKQTNKQIREPLSKGDSRTGLTAFNIQPSLATLASLTPFILHTSE